MTEYEYEYYLVFQKLPNTNTNIIRFHEEDTSKSGKGQTDISYC